jgi:type III restriction enzyme
LRLQFDSNQVYQLRAIESVVDLFLGQPRIGDFLIPDLTPLFGSVSNRFELNEEELLRNLRAVQAINGLTRDASLQTIEETIRTVAGERRVRFPNFSVEMETGTGKTYVYIRTALELNRRYGLRKFIIVVPSVAIREGVLKSLKITQEHLRALYDNVAYRSTVYDSKSITKIRQFAMTEGIEVLVMTIDSFNKDDNVIRQSTDRLQGATPLFLVQSTRPVLILDEPQNMESEGRIRALASLDPLFALRYSATHRNPYNLIYRLTPFEAYRQSLVKKIEVASVVKEDDFNQIFLRVDEIRTKAKTVQAKIAIHQRMAGAGVKEKSYFFKPGDCLESKADRPEYKSFIIDEINVSEQLVSFKNGIEIGVGRTQGADQAILFREQIRYTVEEHLRKQKRLRPMGIKVLSLFFIDRVDNFVGESSTQKSGPTDDGLYPGIIRDLFDEAFDDLRKHFPDFKDKKAVEVRAHYFAQKVRRGGATEAIDSVSGQSVEDKAAYDLIMKDKERLLSFDEPTAFIFSHSALREGWDNPNVSQICTLNQTKSETKKRQEVGRGMRLVVNQDGARVTDDRANILTVVANESYDLFVASLQAEMEDAFGKEGAAPKPVNARQKRLAKRKPLDEFPEEFGALWDKIRLKTRYQVSVDSARLITDVVHALDKVKIDPPRFVASKAEVIANAKEDRFDYQHFGQKTVATLAGRHTVPNVVQMISDLIAHITPPIKLTRRTLTNIIASTTNGQAALDNPQEFALQTARILREKAIQQLVDGIQYFKDGTWYNMTEWVEEEETVSDRLIPVDNSIYDHIVVQSEPERRFVEKLKKRSDVRMFVKLPSWFKVPTPVGQYNPDWGLVMEEVDAFGERGPLLYLIRETKSTTVPDELRGTENQKIHCGSRHFGGALGVNYRVVTSADELP